MRITVLIGDEKREYLLGGDVSSGQRASVLIPAESVFAAENLDAGGFTFVSCLTVPKFADSGYRLIDKAELRQAYPAYYDELAHLAY